MISIIIAVKNDRRIDKTLEELVKIPRPEKTEFLVIDASEGNLDEIKKKFPSVRWIYFHNQTGKKRTFVEQINLGSEKAKGDILAYIDSDCIPTRDWLFNLIKPIREEEEDIVAGRIKSIGGRTIHDVVWETLDSKKYITGCPTMNMAINASILDKIGPRDESFNFGSDIDFTWRATDLGYKIRYNKNAIIYHDWGNFRQEIKRALSYGEARPSLYKKHPHRLKNLFGDMVALIYPLYIIFFPLTFLWPYYPLLILVPIIKNIKRQPLKVVFIKLIFGFGILKELFFLKIWNQQKRYQQSKLEKGCDIEETELPLSVDNIWIGKDDILYGYYDDELVKSIDNGRTWITVYKFTEGEGSRRVWIDSRGTIFAGRDNTGKMYMSKDNGNNWVVSLKFVRQNAPLSNGKSEGFGTLWNMDEDSLGNLYVGEYGGEWDANCAYIHKSTNGGLTWSIAYDSLAYGWPGRHIHMVKVDKKNDYIYASQGDGYKRARLIRSVDHGKTWTTLQARIQDAQYTTMVFFPDYRLFGTDRENPNKIIRTSDDITFSSIFEFNGKINEYVWSSSNNNDITFVGTVSEKAGNYVGLYETRDKGNSWCKVKDLGITTLGYQGVNNISNFSPEGYAYYHDSRNNKTYRFKDIPKPIKGTLSLLEVKDKPH